MATLRAAAAMTLQELTRELGTLHALGCTTGQLAGASAVSQGLLGVIGAMLGVPLGLNLYSGFVETSGVESSVPPGAVGAVAIAAVAVAAAAAAIPALILQRHPTSEALAAE